MQSIKLDPSRETLSSVKLTRPYAGIVHYRVTFSRIKTLLLSLLLYTVIILVTIIIVIMTITIRYTYLYAFPCITFVLILSAVGGGRMTNETASRGPVP